MLAVILRGTFTALVLAASCTPIAHTTFRLHYATVAYRDLAHANNSAACGTTPAHGVEVLAVAPAACPSLEAVDYAAGRIIGIVPKADPRALAGARITYVATMIDCSGELGDLDVAAHRFASGCTLGDEMVVQDHAPIGGGFALHNTLHEMGHAIRWRLGMPDWDGVGGRHEPAMWWERIDGVTFPPTYNDRAFAPTVNPPWPPAMDLCDATGSCPPKVHT